MSVNIEYTPNTEYSLKNITHVSVGTIVRAKFEKADTLFSVYVVAYSSTTINSFVETQSSYSLHFSSQVPRKFQVPIVRLCPHGAMPLFLRYSCACTDIRGLHHQGHTPQSAHQFLFIRTLTFSLYIDFCVKPEPRRRAFNSANRS